MAKARVKVKPQVTASVPAHEHQSTIVYIFGGSGDLAYRKLMPALYNLYLDKYLPVQFNIVGLGRSDYSNQSYRNYIKKGIEEHSRRKDNIDQTWKEFSPCIEYMRADLEDEKSYKAMGAHIKELEDKWKSKPVVIFYMSVAPQLAPDIVARLHNTKL